MNYKYSQNNIDIVAKLYTGVQPTLYMNNKGICNIQLTSWIKQGCTGSP